MIIQVQRSRPGGGVRVKAVAVVHLEWVCAGGGGFAVCRGLFRVTLKGRGG